jgi:hypothetical protein
MPFLTGPKNPRKNENVITFIKRAAPVASKAGKNNKCTCFPSANDVRGVQMKSVTSRH